MRPLAAGLALLLAGCGSGGEAPVQARPFEDPGYASSGAYTLYYAANPTTDLPVEVLRAHGVTPSQRRILVSVSLVRRDGADAPRPARAVVVVAVRTLIGEPVSLRVREFDAAGTPSYVAAFDARNREPYLFEVTARAAGDAPVTARFQREFWLE
jgi:Domain of unknown function (DUF4426)